ncbi:hypothetical protein QAD02_017526 [Eretmocerus hayati]|uniref:Uncharacterized protein n=1 Tax=Eretmocerus hayati TaxID=131215 RepID=A0ACC2PEJ7_9HYME|nr:hypothetical protein QAD02_017526 [Eretmocerus hayati]
MHCQETPANNTDFPMNVLFKLIKEDVSPFKVDVIMELTNFSSSRGVEFVQKANQDLACRNMHLETARLTRYNTKKSKRRRRFPGLIDDAEIDGFLREAGMSLTMGILENRSGSNAEQKMLQMFHFFCDLHRTKRVKYLLNLITECEIDLKIFLRIVWSKEFIDFTVIQWICKDQPEGIQIGSMGALIDCGAFVFSYNPFSDIFSREELTSETKLFPDKFNDLHGYALTALLEENDLDARVGSDGTSYHGVDMILMNTLMDAMNCSLHFKIVNDVYVSPDPWKYELEYGYPAFKLPINTWDLQIISQLPSSIKRMLAFREQVGKASIPVASSYHLYLMRPKIHERDVRISFLAIAAFVVLFLTASMFAIWSRLLGFREPNWSVLNIATAQMGGSIQILGRMKLSKVIFQMSMYVATFIIVTFGADYMLQLYIVSFRELPQIKTLKDLAHLDVNLFMISIQLYGQFQYLGKDAVVQSIYDRTQARDLEAGFHSFCTLLTAANSNTILDGKINLCLKPSREPTIIMKSDYRFQVDKIEDPVAIFTPNLEFESKGHEWQLSMKDRVEKLMYKFSEIGLLEEWDELSTQPPRRVGPADDPTDSEEDSRDGNIPFQDQLWPIFTVGCTLSVLALIGEWIWKIFIEKTKLGELTKEFYNYSRSNSAQPMPVDILSRVRSQGLKINLCEDSTKTKF